MTRTAEEIVRDWTRFIGKLPGLKVLECSEYPGKVWVRSEDIVEHIPAALADAYLHHLCAKALIEQHKVTLARSAMKNESSAYWSFGPGLWGWADTYEQAIRDARDATWLDAAKSETEPGPVRDVRVNLGSNEVWIDGVRYTPENTDD